MKLQPISEAEALALIHDKFSRGKQASLLVTGTSMVPFLRHRKDWVVLSPAVGTMHRGQILLFRAGDRLLLHRLRKKQNGYYIMNGDGQERLEKIRPQQVEAVVTHIVRQSGRTLRCDGVLFWVLTCLWWPTRPLRSRLLAAAEGIRAIAGRKGGSA